jgi:hypothetical protein
MAGAHGNAGAVASPQASSTMQIATSAVSGNTNPGPNTHGNINDSTKTFRRITLLELFHMSCGDLAYQYFSRTSKIRGCILPRFPVENEKEVALLAAEMEAKEKAENEVRTNVLVLCAADMSGGKG